MTKKNDNQRPIDLVPEPVNIVPMNLDEIEAATERLREAFKAALAVPPADFPADKKIAINLSLKAILIPDLTIHITKNECMPSVE